jgi:methylamine dehydrogenase heavy chain
LTAHESSTLLVATERPEIYVADTAWSRNTHGTRTDFITIYDQRSLKVIGDIVLPGAKRALVVPMQGMMSFADHEKLALVWNFTPTSSVTVVDLMQRKVLGAIDTPGCSLAYATEDRSFATLCQGGTLLRVWLDNAGKAVKHVESKAFNTLDSDPLLTTSTTVGTTRYFPTMLGRVQPIDLSGDEVRILPGWSLVQTAESAESWRPSGLQPISSDAAGHLYVIMQRDAHEGSYKAPGTEVWEFDSATRERIRRIRLVRPGTAIEVTHGAEPLLLVGASDRLDVYELTGGSLVRSLDSTSARGGVLIDSVR